jgi:hypothetical protein
MGESVVKFTRLNRHSKYALGMIRAVVDAHSQALENFKVEGGDDLYPNAEGSWTFQAGGDGGVSESIWNGIVRNFYGEELVADLFAAEPLANPPKTREEKIKELLTGPYLVFDTSGPQKSYTPTGKQGDSFGKHDKFCFCTSPNTSAPFIQWEVGEAYVEDETTYYRLKSNMDAAGTIRISIPIPYNSYQTIQQGKNGTDEMDRGIVTGYVRAH